MVRSGPRTGHQDEPQSWVFPSQQRENNGDSDDFIMNSGSQDTGEV